MTFQQKENPHDRIDQSHPWRRFYSRTSSYHGLAWWLFRAFAAILSWFPCTHRIRQASQSHSKLLITGIYNNHTIPFKVNLKWNDSLSGICRDHGNHLRLMHPTRIHKNTLWTLCNLCVLCIKTLFFLKFFYSERHIKWAYWVQAKIPQRARRTQRITKFFISSCLLSLLRAFVVKKC